MGKSALGKGKVWAMVMLKSVLASHEFPVSYLVCSGGRQRYQKERGSSFGQVCSRRWHPGFSQMSNTGKAIPVRNVQGSYLFALGNKAKNCKNHECFVPLLH